MNSESNPEFQPWSAGQGAAFDQLFEIADTFFARGRSLRAEKLLQGRFDTLVVGASGTGKSHLLRGLSRSLGIPILRISSAEWVVMAARERPHTMERVYSFVEENERGIIHIDELDKFRSNPSSDWSISVAVEAFLLLDRTLQQPLGEVKWTERLQDRLAQSILIIGTGTWQGVWSDCDKPLVGFRAGRESDQGTVQREIIKSGIIPTELLRRFRSRLITLPPPTVDDYRKAAGLFGLDELAAKVGVHLDYSAAKVSSLGARWLEEQMADVLCMARRNGIQVGLNQPESLPEVVEETDDDFEMTDLL